MSELKPCPDCGSERYPYLNLEHYIANGEMDVLSQVRAQCDTCGWRTLWHRSVKGCAAEWNEAKVEE